MKQSLKHKQILLILGGGVAAYKALELIRRLKEKGAILDVVLTEAAKQFVTELSAASLLGKPVFSNLFAHSTHHDVHHIRLARQKDLIIFAPLTASRMAKLACGFADDLAGAVYLATNAPLLFCPAMNPSMWQHKATQENKKRLEKRNHHFVGPDFGEMAESGEIGLGRMSEISDIMTKIEALLAADPLERTLNGQHILVTAGPTQEKLDPIRYLSNYSSGKQGYAIAQAFAEQGAKVTLISGPVSLEAPKNVERQFVTSSEEMLKATLKALPADIAIFTAAVSDWRFETYFSQKLKKKSQQEHLNLNLVKTPDILAFIANSKKRPKLVIGFAAETENGPENALKKLKNKNADAMLYNDVNPQTNDKGEKIPIMGGDYNAITLFSKTQVLEWPLSTKENLAKKIVLYCIEQLKQKI